MAIQEQGKIQIKIQSQIWPGTWTMALRHCTSDTRRYSSAFRIMAGPMKLPKFSIESICGNESLHVTDPGDLGENGKYCLWIRCRGSLWGKDWGKNWGQCA